jgi:hypothetical protein
MIEMLATLLIVIAAPKGEMRMQFYVPTIEQCKQAEPGPIKRAEGMSERTVPQARRTQPARERCDLICPDLPKV